MDDIVNKRPANISLLNLTRTDLETLRRVEVLDIFDGSSKNFHDRGLFSTAIFGKYAEEARSKTFAYIDLLIPVFHPKIFEAITATKELYGMIMSGKAYATWDTETKDFIKSDITTGYTGFAFFLAHYKDLKFEERDSELRKLNITLINKFREGKDLTLIDKLLVMPAGLRDYEVDDTGKPSEDEINNLYRRVLGVANMINTTVYKVSPASMDATRWGLQRAVNDVYDYLFSLLNGKHKLLQASWAARRVADTTRNVISPIQNTIASLDDPRIPSPNETIMGLYQFMKGTIRRAIYSIRAGILTQVFTSPSTPANLIDTKTLKRVQIQIHPEHYDAWMSPEGLEKTITKFGSEYIRHEPLMIGGYYAALLYNDPVKAHIRVVFDIDEIPEPLRVHVSPMTLAEFYYLSLYKDVDNTALWVTRYPIDSPGSIYASMIYLRTTTKSVMRAIVDYDLNPTDEICKEFPVRGATFVSSLAPHGSHYGGLGADNDGDMVSANPVLTDDAVAGVKKDLMQWAYYLDSEGALKYSLKSTVAEELLKNITGGLR